MSAPNNLFPFKPPFHPPSLNINSGKFFSHCSSSSVEHFQMVVCCFKFTKLLSSPVSVSQSIVYFMERVLCSSVLYLLSIFQSRKMCRCCIRHREQGLEGKMASSLLFPNSIKKLVDHPTQLICIWILLC